MNITTNTQISQWAFNDTNKLKQMDNNVYAYEQNKKKNQRCDAPCFQKAIIVGASTIDIN